MSKVQFSWNNQKGYGIILLFFGWALILQIPAIYYNYVVIKVPSSSNVWLMFAAAFVFVTAILGSFLTTIYENLFDPFDSVLVNTHTVVLVSFLVFYVFYLFSVPTLLLIQPFFGLPTQITIFGWGQYLISLISGIIGITIFWYLSELVAQSKTKTSSSSTAPSQ